MIHTMPKHSTITSSRSLPPFSSRLWWVIFIKFVRWSNKGSFRFLRCGWHTAHFNECWPESVQIVSSCVFQARGRHSNTSGQLFIQSFLPSNLTIQFFDDSWQWRQWLSTLFRLQFFNPFKSGQKRSKVIQLEIVRESRYNIREGERYSWGEKREEVRIIEMRRKDRRKEMY